MRSKGLIAVVIVILLLGASVLYLNSDLEDEEKPSGDSKTSDTDDDSDIVLGNITSFDDAVNHMSFILFRKIVNDPENNGNKFYSPYSVFTALAMTYEGARGNTAVEMGNVLGIDQDNDSFHDYMKSLYVYLNFNDDYNISTANALWPDVGFNLLDDFVNIVETYYGGKATEVEYGDPVEAARIINEWVEEQTNNLIKDLVPPGAIDPVMTKLILTNAIYFKGIWQVQFDEANTTDRDFTLSNGESIKVATMKLIDTEDKFNYSETDDLQILELPYTGNDISMMILLPKDGVDINDVINSINKDSYKEWIDSMTKKEADIYLPKYKIETSYSMRNYLIGLGMPDAFSSANADFSGITGSRDLFISQVLHKAYVEVNEEGTEAAAATAVIMELTAIDPNIEPQRITFDCDHPFLFLIQHKETKTVLFMGSMEDPTS